MEAIRAWVVGGGTVVTVYSSAASADLNNVDLTLVMITWIFEVP
jgi:hypothetical protein